jgi:hypothetical protein
MLELRRLRLLRERVGEFLVFESGLNCEFGLAEVAVDGHGDHGHHGEDGHGEGHGHDAVASAEEVTRDDHGHGHDHGHGEAEVEAGHDDHGSHEADHAEGAAHAHQEADAHEHGDHAHTDVHAEYRVSCAAPLAGTRLRFELPSVFPGIERLDIQILSESGETGGRIGADGSVTL